jgi:hypothetical protein
MDADACQQFLELLATAFSPTVVQTYSVACFRAALSDPQSVHLVLTILENPAAFLATDRTLALGFLRRLGTRDGFVREACDSHLCPIFNLPSLLLSDTPDASVLAECVQMLFAKLAVATPIYFEFRDLILTRLSSPESLVPCLRLAKRILPVSVHPDYIVCPEQEEFYQQFREAIKPLFNPDNLPNPELAKPFRRILRIWTDLFSTFRSYFTPDEYEIQMITEVLTTGNLVLLNVAAWFVRHAAWTCKREPNLPDEVGLLIDAAIHFCAEPPAGIDKEEDLAQICGNFIGAVQIALEDENQILRPEVVTSRSLPLLIQICVRHPQIPAFEAANRDVNPADG